MASAEILSALPPSQNATPTAGASVPTQHMPYRHTQVASLPTPLNTLAQGPIPTPVAPYIPIDHNEMVPIPTNNPIPTHTPDRIPNAPQSRMAQNLPQLPASTASTQSRNCRPLPSSHGNQASPENLSTHSDPCPHTPQRLPRSQPPVPPAPEEVAPALSPPVACIRLEMLPPVNPSPHSPSQKTQPQHKTKISDS